MTSSVEIEVWVLNRGSRFHSPCPVWPGNKQDPCQT